MSCRAVRAWAARPLLLMEQSPTMQMMDRFSSTSIVPYLVKSFLISSRWQVLSMVSEMATSEVAIMSIGVFHDSNISNTLRTKPYARSMLLDFTLIAVIPSLAATALKFRTGLSLVIRVPSSPGFIVFFMRTGMFALFAGCILEGCRIFAPKYANSAASSKERLRSGWVFFT